jgi:hypothetical protein
LINRTASHRSEVGGCFWREAAVHTQTDLAETIEFPTGKEMPKISSACARRGQVARQFDMDESTPFRLN